MKKTKEPTKAPTTEQTSPQDTAPKEKAAQFAPTLTQPLASMPPSEQVQVQTAPVAQTDDHSDAPHYFNQVFIMEQLDRFVENLFDGEVASLPIPSDVVTQASDLVREMREDSVEINSLTTQLNELDNRMKATTSKIVIKQLEESYMDVNRALTILRNRRLGFHSDLDNIVRKICIEHQAQVTGYNDLVKGHIDPTAQKNT
mgnify:CR=1 FL=1